MYNYKKSNKCTISLCFLTMRLYNLNIIAFSLKSFFFIDNPDGAADSAGDGLPPPQGHCPQGPQDKEHLPRERPRNHQGCRQQICFNLSG